MEQYAHEIGTECYCPVEDGNIQTGMNYISKKAPENVILEFYYDKDGRIVIIDKDIVKAIPDMTERERLEWLTLFSYNEDIITTSKAQELLGLETIEDLREWLKENAKKYVTEGK